MEVNNGQYQTYLSALLNGQHRECHAMVSGFIEQGMTVKELYLDVFQRSLYDVGIKWQKDEIGIATEHMATVMTESLMSLTYPLLFNKIHQDRRAIITCVQGEFHQIGSRMVADFFEMAGWHGHALGANTPTSSLLRAIDEIKPDILGISVSLTFHITKMQEMIEAVLSHQPALQIIVGGRAFHNHEAKQKILKLTFDYPQVQYIESLDKLETFINGYGYDDAQCHLCG